MSIQVLPQPEFPEKYSEQYYRTTNYSDYQDREPRYHQMAREIFSALSSVGVINQKSRLLDYGCALGYLVNGFRKLGVVCEGFDISDHARIVAEGSGIQFVKEGIFDLIMAMDVLEHMEDEEINVMLETFLAHRLLVRIPCSTDGGETFHLQISRNDPTHINCRTKTQWLEFFEQFGYRMFLPLNLYSIYDSSGVMAGLLIRA